MNTSASITPERQAKLEKLVGINLRRLRNERGLSQQQVGEKLGISFQQIQKFENGTNRISAGRLFVLAQFLNAPLIEFFQDARF
ncbi:helix-turn-helix transcriptional regulator [Hoeflea sp. EC-HK425]|uniref:helix-turn-helix domain-containing protein n=1 Tax=Hoeflea sp. EC-HK425 TaxID=2038388 RepID=UPI001255F4EC